MSDQGQSVTTSPEIRPIPLGPFETNAHIVTDGPASGTDTCWVVDPGYEPEPLLNELASLGLRAERIVLTHAHSDHIAGIRDVRRAFPDAPIVMHAAEKDWLSNPTLNLSEALGVPFTTPDADEFVAHGDTLTLGSTTFRVAHTPGHSPGSVSFIHEPSNQAIVGDTLFSGSIGRTDLPGGSMDTLAASIRDHLYTLDPKTTAYPGHGPTTTIAHERDSNPFVRAQ